MYTTYYSIKGEPFLNKPTPSLFFYSEAHTKAWDFLTGSIESQEPHLMVAGEYGAGKTLLCLKLADYLKQNDRQPVAYISTPMQSYLEVLRRIYTALDLGPIEEGADEEALHFKIYRHFESQPNNSLIIILDDVQEYDARQLNQIRLLSTFSHDGFFPIRLFLFGNTAFIQRLNSQDLKPLDQRIKRRYHLSNLTFNEAKEYIFFQLIEAGAQGFPLFPDESIERIVALSQGTPRRINNICDMCLLVGSTQGTNTINLDVVQEAAVNLGWEPSPQSIQSSETTESEQLPDASDSPPSSQVEAVVPAASSVQAVEPEPPAPVQPLPQEDPGLGEAQPERIQINYTVWGWRLAALLAIMTILTITIPM
ncbi:MAG: AAA family ATPase [Endozoicomonas sp.]